MNARLLGGWMGSVLWLAVGVLVSVGVASILTIGIFVLASAALLTLVGIVMGLHRKPFILAAISGLASAPLYIAWLNRHGPGTYCWTSGTTTSCEDQWSPWLFVAVGLVLLAAGPLAMFLAHRREASGR